VSLPYLLFPAGYGGDSKEAGRACRMARSQAEPGNEGGEREGTHPIVATPFTGALFRFPTPPALVRRRKACGYTSLPHN